MACRPWLAPRRSSESERRSFPTDGLRHWLTFVGLPRLSQRSCRSKSTQSLVR
nr:MAG TPA: hypothetical protein [Caudoviricetes sp.]